MRNVFVTLILLFASSNGDVTGDLKNAVNNIIPNNVRNVANKIITDGIVDIQSAVLLVDPQHTIATQQFLSSLLEGPLAKMQKTFNSIIDTHGSIIGNTNKLEDLSEYIRELGTVIGGYINTVGSTSGSTQEAVQQLAAISQMCGEKMTNALKNSGQPVSQSVYDSINNAAANINNAAENSVGNI